ncbi:glycosyltransferase family 2 protein [Desulfotignum balticum]|uniref:glycosyltransferase family 2 protein n=1 Tax=Desulfotignum balticum TaxID=115781 RepID=UPI0004165B36|nr:glycosyltransferase family 2 protein [Desulfotignum balticum]
MTDIVPICSVLIVNYNGGELVLDSVRAVLISSVRVQVLVWDNASADGSPDSLEKAFAGESRFALFRYSENIGFAAGVNRLLEKAKGKFLLLLNPDCVLKTDTIETVAQVLDENPDAGMAGCLLRNPDGSEQAGCRRQVPTPWRSLVRVLHLDKVFPGHPRFQSISLNSTPLPDNPVEAEAISGAFMLVTRKALEDVGPLDDHYFMHCEDLDWCMRFRQKGWQILFVPDASAIHHQGHCSISRPIAVELYKHKGMLRFYDKFFRHQYPGLLMWLVKASVWLRFGLVTLYHWAGNRLRGSGHA